VTGGQLYSAEIEKLLKKKKAKIGSKVRIKKGNNSYEGILMPQTDLGDPNSIVLKLENGYNIGISYEKKIKLRKLKGGKRIRFKSAKLTARPDPTKPTVSVLGCGGTIASRVEYTTGAVFPAFSPGDMLLSFPQLKEIANIRGHKLFDLFSEDMTAEHWKIIAEETAKSIEEGVDGVVLMHGTDTMHYTASVLSFMLQSMPVPVVLVGSQRSSDRGSSDNAMNLTCAVNAAAKADIARVMVCMHANMDDDYCHLHEGTKVRKLHTSRRDAFKSTNVLPYARVWYTERPGHIEYLRKDFERRNSNRLTVDTKINPNVALVHVHPNIKPEFIDSLNSYDGVVIAGTGLGHVPSNPSEDSLAKSIVPSLKNLVAIGVPVVIAPQTIFGRLNMNVYTTGRVLNEIGVIGNGCDWTPETALVKLMWVLGHTKEPGRVRDMMLKNYAGEISERTEVMDGE
jgi:glutamyl-tRNA(Gln) amidotransferase subunit D